MAQTSFSKPEVMVVFDSYPPQIQEKLLELRELIFKTASEIEGVGKLEETLKWGQPSYLMPVSKSGSTMRIDKVKHKDNQYAIFFNCNTTIIETCQREYPEFTYEGKRAIIFDIDDKPSTSALKDCIAMALTYHLRKKTKN